MINRLIKGRYSNSAALLSALAFVIGVISGRECSQILENLVLY